MARSNYLKNYIPGVALAVSLAIIFLSWALVAQAAVLPEGVSQEQINAALKDLSQTAGQTIGTIEAAQTFCDQEKNFTTCAQVGKAHDLYKPEEIRQVDAFVSEIKGQVAQQIQSCQTTECLVNVANGLAQKIAAKTPAIATQLELTPALVQKKLAVVQAAKEVGVNFDDCRQMDPETASVELLRGCARLAKDSRLQEFVPAAVKQTVGDFGENLDKVVALRQGLSGGTVNCGGSTSLEACGNYCLNPSAAARTQGTAAIPPVCRQIAQRFFGSEGVKQLEQAYQQVGQAREYYFKKAEFTVFTTPDGRTIASPEEIGRYMETSMQEGCVECIDKGMEFMVAQGFVPAKDAEFAKKMARKIKEKGGISSFETCAQNPQACQEFVPEDHRGDFAVFAEIEKIMQQEIGFDPRDCERGGSDPTIGLRCLEGSKRALPKLEALAAKSTEVRKIIEEIKGHIARGEEFSKRKDQFQQVFQGQGGPGGCRSETECRSYCSDPNHGPECISFGAKEGIFKGQEAVQRFQQFNQNLQGSQQFGPPPFPGQGPYPGFQPPGQGGFPPPGQYPGFTQPGPGFYPPPGQPGPVGPSPECFAAIQFGDYVKAKELCTVVIPRFDPVITPIGPPVTPYPIACPLPVQPAVECPAGQRFQEYRDERGCFNYGPCVPWYTYTPYPIGEINFPYTFGNGKTVNSYEEARAYCSGPAAGQRIGDECKAKFGVVYASYSPGPSPSGRCPGTFAHDMGGYCMLNNDTSRCAPYDQASNETSYTAAACSSYPGPTYSPGPGTSCSQSLVNLLGSGCHQMYTDSSGRNVFCDGPMTKSAKEGDTVTTSGCSSSGGPTYSPYPTSSPTSGGSCPSGSHVMYINNAGGYCMSDADTAKCGPLNSTSVSSFGSCTTYQGTYTPYPTSTYSPPPGATASACPAGYYWNGTACVSSTSTSQCPAGAHNMGSYCMSDSDTSKCGPFGSTGVSSFGSCSSYQTATTYTPYPTCPSGQWWDTATSSCKSSTSTACPSGQYWNGTACVVSSTTYTPYPTSQYTPPPSCPDGQYWGGTACVNYSTPVPTPVPTQDPAVSCSQSGGTWTGSSCQFPTPAPTPTPSPTTGFNYEAHQTALAMTIMACANEDGKWDPNTLDCRLTVKSFLANIFRPLVNLFR